jgi:hypothetical protein
MSGQEDLVSLERAVDVCRGPYGEGINIERLLDELQLDGWRRDV